MNCSRCEDEQNLVAFQFRGNIYYRAYKPIPPGNELLVWYRESYAKELGISLDDNDKLVHDGSWANGRELSYSLLSLIVFQSLQRLIQCLKDICSV